jgi:bifunctional non-homologous end joining protein LigD
VAATDQVVEIQGRELKLSNLDKVMYPETGFTKGQMLDYYARIGPTLVPHLKGRPLTLKRYPDGVGGESFFEKNCPKHRPDWVNTTPVFVDRRGGEIDFCLCDDLPTLTWLAQLAALELHPSLSLAPKIEQPTALVFDLDPGKPADVLDCARVALQVRELFGEFGLECFVKTSGSKGLQTYLPLNTKVTYETTKPYARAVAQLLEKRDPNRVTSVMAKEKRKGKVFVDWSQNDQKKTTVAVYSLRAREHPTVSTPIKWEEVEEACAADDPDLLRFESGDVLERVEEHGDLFAPVLELKQKLPELG